jgi:nanoRNase/pAp phosphatase (c-di-AMP/oligoRNAs hydrolase)
MVSQDVYQKAREYISSAQKVRICINNRSSLDTHLAAAATAKHLSAQGKEVTVCTNGDLIHKHKELFERFNVEYNESTSPRRYVITIDHAEGGIEKVSYDDVDGKFHLYITPSEDAPDFDFEKVSYTQGGGKADSIVTFGFRSVSWFGDIYEEQKELFESVPVININDLPGDQEFGSIQLVDTEISVSEIVLSLFDGTVSDEEYAGLLLTGLLDHLQPLQRNDYKIGSVEAMVKLVKMGTDLKEAFKLLYFDKTLENFEKERRVMNNVKMDSESGIIWSTVSKFDLAQAGVDRENFMLDGRIIFNICRAFTVAFVIYEVGEREIVVECESNDKQVSVEDLLHEYKMAGDEARAYCTVRDKSLADVEREVLEMITSKLGVSPLEIGPGQEGGKVVPPAVPEADIPSGTGLTPDAATLDNGDSGQKSARDGSSKDERLVTPPPVNPEKAR